jgi:hypothetical protein
MLLEPRVFLNVSAIASEIGIHRSSVIRAHQAKRLPPADGVDLRGRPLWLAKRLPELKKSFF